MITKIKDFFNKSVLLDKESSETGNEKRIQIAACSLLMEMAGIDNEFSDDERDRIIVIIKKEFDLDNQTAEELMELSKMELRGSVDLWQFTNLIQ